MASRTRCGTGGYRRNVSSSVMRNRGQFARSSRDDTRSGGKPATSARRRLLLCAVERQEIGRPEQHTRRRLKAAEDHCRALVTHLGGGERLCRLGIAGGQKQIQ